MVASGTAIARSRSTTRITLPHSRTETKRMNYTANEFFWFFGITFVLYYLIGNGSFQVLFVVAASLLFYAWESPSLLIVFLASWLITGLTSYGVIAGRSLRMSRTFAVLGVVANLVLLGFFKYKFLFIDSSASVSQTSARSPAEWLLLAPLPIGISFYTFHGISLLVDAYRGSAAINDSATGGLAKYLNKTLLYLVFFPQLIAGPIIKAKDFYPQVSAKKFSDIEWSICFRILVTGYFLKSVIADNLAEQTYWIAYPYFQWKSSGELLLMLYGYSAQIFADYAGYSLIAVGLARLLGYRLPDNFNFPYVSSSISEFWRRWNISLSSWLRDYLYVPLGGSQRGRVRTYLNLMIVMFLGGLWHGAAWSFAVWGLWHGIGLALERPWLGSRFMTSTGRLARGIRIFLVFNFVTIGWLFFKLQEFSHAQLYLWSLVHNQATGIDTSALYYIVIFSSAVALYHVFSLFKSRIPRTVQNILYGFMLFMIATNAGPTTAFIYFQF
jgi:alginate O-acetyltransferase complex protein AlgI